MFINFRVLEIHLFCNLQLFYWHFLEILWLFIFYVFYKSYRNQELIGSQRKDTTVRANQSWIGNNILVIRLLLEDRLGFEKTNDWNSNPRRAVITILRMAPVKEKKPAVGKRKLLQLSCLLAVFS